MIKTATASVRAQRTAEPGSKNPWLALACLFASAHRLRQTTADS